MPRLADVVAALERLYDPSLAEDWDAVGLVCGDPDTEVTHVHLAVDPVAAVADEAVREGAQLLVTHHPLFLRGVHGVAATTPKGRVVHRLLGAGCALHVAHTNADKAVPGVSDALAAALGLVDLDPLQPEPEQLDALAVFVPVADAHRVLDELAAAGAGRLGDYERAAWTTRGEGTFRPLPGADPAVGRVGSTEVVAETRVELVLPRARRRAVVAALRASHPYEEPAYTLVEHAGVERGAGLGRVGELPGAPPLAEFAERVAGALPATAWGIRVAGDPDRPVRRVAVCGGAGDSLIRAARASGADAYVTADLRHHPVSEALEDGPMALVDAAHWATEWPWLEHAGDALRAALSESGTTVRTTVSRLVTDPWTSARRPLSTDPGSPR